jgi:carotenoid 1,2-hydratase
VIELPTLSGAYRWLYLDVHAGDCTAVAIFMLGSVFSPRYSAGARRGASPASHSAVNFALYAGGTRRTWVLSEYPRAEVDGSGELLRIGRSSWRSGPTGAEVRIVDRTAPWGAPAEAFIELELPNLPGPELRLVEGQPHWWRPFAPHARARLRVPAQGLDVEGSGYHDGNHGTEPLGGGLGGWRWTRVHTDRETRVLYEPAAASALLVTARGGEVRLQAGAVPDVGVRRSAWGLQVPASYAAVAGATVGAPRLLESSPFYARLEAAGPGVHVLGEVADFRRFHRPLVRWMAGLRTRVEASR